MSKSNLLLILLIFLGAIFFLPSFVDSLFEGQKQDAIKTCENFNGTHFQSKHGLNYCELQNGEIKGEWWLLLH